MSIDDEPTKEDLERAAKLDIAAGVIGEMLDECETDGEGNEDREYLTEVRDDISHLAAVLRGEEMEGEEED